MAIKSQFLIAFNEVCREKHLPPETVLDALKTALVSAYRRNSNVSNAQNVTAEIDPRTGDVSIYAEKEVAESVIDERTEVTLEQGRRYKPDAQLGDIVMAESTPKDFGRIAAQTAKQVILQRVREAEREHLFEEFSGREGEIVNGTVQSISNGNITVGLGRTEATLPRNQQIGGERYRTHEKIRVYILEVKRSSKGPQIIVSRNHRNLLRRLLELEVPEIYNGQVDIKSIAREAGGRSKVAVQAMQPGVDAVGACVGIRGSRIQSIVRELNDEKIDVIPWDSDPKNFIAQSLSPARVAQVFLDDDPMNGRTATVMVPDDQLSLAIGREGQNARLAAKLTGWRIDIKSLTEAGRESLSQLDHPLVDLAVARDKALHDRVRAVLEKKDAGRLIGGDDYADISRLVAGVEGRIIASRATEHEAQRRRQYEARKRVPELFWQLDLEELNLPMSIHNRLAENGYNTVGAVALALETNPGQLLTIDGFGDAAMEKVRVRLAELAEEPEQAGSLVPGSTGDLDLLELQDLVADAAEAGEPAEPLGALADELAEAVQETAEMLEVVEPLLVDDVFLAADLAEAVEETRALTPLDDLSQSLVSIVEESKPTAPTREPVAPVRIARPTAAEEDEDADRKPRPGAKPVAKQIVFDEAAGRAVSKKKRKKNRSRGGGWGDFDETEEF